MQNVHFTPPQIADLFGVNVSTIKRWVDKGMLQSTKTPGGHRRINQDQLAKFIAAYPQYQSKSYVINRFTKKQTNKATDWKNYYGLLYNNKVQEAEKYIEEQFILQTPLVTILDTIITPALAHIGSEWQRGNISIYEEHRMSFVIRRQLIRLDQLIPEAPSKSPVTILACAPQDHHEIPLQMAALVLKQNNWRPQPLGINVPIKELQKACLSAKAKLVCLTKTYSKNSTGTDYLKKLCTWAKKQSDVHIVFGGNGWTKKVQTSPPELSEYIDSMQSFEQTIENYIN